MTETIDWREVSEGLSDQGYARVARYLAGEECERIAAYYDDDARFRSRVVMEQHHFGLGEYAYFKRPLPREVSQLRTALYRGLAPIASRWAAQLAGGDPFPKTLKGYLEQCQQGGQTRPTPLLLRYRAGGYNCLHRDRYGDLVFPIQAMVLLSRPGTDFEGGEFLLVENRPRKQSLAHALAPEQGDLVFFASDTRPVRSVRGMSRASMRHGVSRVHSGERTTLGLIFHDAT